MWIKHNFTFVVISKIMWITSQGLRKTFLLGIPYSQFFQECDLHLLDSSHQFLNKLDHFNPTHPVHFTKL